MRKAKFNLQYCYGIKKLNNELDFSYRTYAIYAPNGVMKTSFAKTLKDYSKGIKPSDLVFPDRETICEISFDGQTAEPKSIFVIESYNSEFRSDKMSTLMANKELKEQYDSAHKEIDKSRESFTKKLKQLSGLTGRKDSIEDTLESIFKKNFFDFLVEVENEVRNSESLPLHHIQYQKIYNDKSLEFLSDQAFKADIQEYIQKYDELIESSPYLGKDFKFHHAEAVQKQLSSNNFFKGGHSVNLFDGASENKYTSEEDFQRILEEERNKVFSNTDLQAKFDKISAKLSNQQLKDLRDYLIDNKEVLPELADIQGLSKKLWMAYIVNQKEIYFDLIAKYKAGQDQIKKLVTQANGQKTEWEEVIRIFNTRFCHLPFSLRLRNKEDVILKSNVETIEFVFKEGSEERTYLDKDKSELLKVLSTGEQRALYILNVIFEVEARIKDGNPIFFVIDDIADSFDYKNKYAIIEYLKYMSEMTNVFMIILTHNFDFLRTLESRTVAPAHQCLMAVKYEDQIKLEGFKRSYIRNPFEMWKKELNDKVKLIASVPFTRNVIEYTQGSKDNADYLTLTSALHFKEETDNLTVSSLADVYARTFPNINFPEENKTRKLLELIFEAADECLKTPEGINLENKIVLSLAIRLLAEKFMLNKISDKSPISSDQTWALMDRYEKEYNNEVRFLEILKRVVLITPANIHINSFMYEPILDMGDGELRELYQVVKSELTINSASPPPASA